MQIAAKSNNVYLFHINVHSSHSVGRCNEDGGPGTLDNLAEYGDGFYCSRHEKPMAQKMWVALSIECSDKLSSLTQLIIAYSKRAKHSLFPDPRVVNRQGHGEKERDAAFIHVTYLLLLFKKKELKKEKEGRESIFNCK